MCLIKTIKLNELEKYYITNILEEDKVVIKVLYKDTINKFFFKKYNYYSPYENYKYIKGKLNTSPLGIFVNKESDTQNLNVIVNEGFHSFRTEEDAYIYRKTVLFNYFKAVLCKCIIPKGSTIVYNNSEIVSNQIIFIEELK